MSMRLPGSRAPDCVLVVDGEDVPAVTGEPVAVALAAAGRKVLSRSVKYHRPRGAACFAGRCEGCLMRVDGVPSRMTCRVPARAGLRVETQNVLGTAGIDLLAATDWFFPEGMNHHEMFTWNKAANLAMQSVARHVAGVGRLPDAPSPTIAPARRDVDVVVIGAGRSGLDVARACAAAGLRTLVLDEEPRVGGRRAFAPALDASDEEETPVAGAPAAPLEILLSHAAVAIHEPRLERVVVLADGPDAALRVHARRVVLATGRTEGSWAFPGNDRPGVMGAEAAARLLAHGVRPGRRAVLVGDGDEGALARLAEALVEAGASVDGPHRLDALVAAHGRHALSRVTLRRDGREGKVPCDLLVVDAPSSATFELAAQAGANVVFRGRGFEVEAAPGDGATRAPWARVVGRAAAVEPRAARRAQSLAAAAAIAEELRDG